MATLTLLFYSGIAIAGGIGLLLAKEWGRILSIAHAAVSVLWVPIGTVIGILVLIYLLRDETKQYFSPETQ